MQIAIKTTKGNYINVVTEKEARIRFEKFQKKMNFYLIWLLPFSFLISPFLFFLVLFYIYFAYEKFNRFFFGNKIKKDYYRTLLRPQLSKKVYSIVGYKVPIEELDEHLNIIKREDTDELKAKAKKMKKIPYMQVGFNIDILTRHFAFLGTTGAGKTETLMSFFTDVIKNGGGVLMIDGKSDSDIEFKLYRLCEEHNYETQFNLILFNSAEMRPETHTYSPFLTFTPFKLKMFISDLLDAISGKAEGNGDYFKNRGKVMLNNIVDYFKIRYDYYEESFTVNDIGGATNSLEYSNLYYMIFGMMIDLESKIRQNDNEKLRMYLNIAKKVKVPKYDYFKSIETLNEYVNQNPAIAKEIEGLIGVDLAFMRNLLTLFTSIDGYISGVHPTWWRYAQAVGYVIYSKLKETNKNYLYTEPNVVNMGDVRLVYQEIKQNPIHKSILKKINDNIGGIFKLEMVQGFYQTYKEAVGLEEAEETIERLNNDAMQQHSYADQQWTKMFDMFRQYSHIFTTPYPEVDGDDIVTNNKVLYVMIPVLEYGTDEVKFLAKIFILMVKAITATALAAEKQNAFDIQIAIYKNKLKPRPVFICVFDEWGSYATDGMSVILAQARSLLISVIVSTQDEVSFKVTEEELKRARANLSKIILQAKDPDIIETIDKYLPEYKIFTSKEYQKDIHDEDLIKGSLTDLQIEKEKLFDSKKIAEFGKGFGILLANDNNPLLMQSYYVGGEKNKTYIRRFEGFREYLKKL